MKKILKILLSIGIGIQFLNANDIQLSNGSKVELLSGDKKTACEVILCLSSPHRPNECVPPLQRYFAIKFKKPWQTIQARKDFLNLCPQDNSDQDFIRYATEILPEVDEECSLHSLNQRIEKRQFGNEMFCQNDSNGEQICRSVAKVGYKINSVATNSCALLSSSKYTDYRLKYTCPNKFYSEEEWNSGKEIVSEISKEEFDKTHEMFKLSVKKWELSQQNNWKQHYVLVTHYYKTKPIKKDCWINENGK